MLQSHISHYGRDWMIPKVFTWTNSQVNKTCFWILNLEYCNSVNFNMGVDGKLSGAFTVRPLVWPCPQVRSWGGVGWVSLVPQKLSVGRKRVASFYLPLKSLIGSESILPSYIPWEHHCTRPNSDIIRRSAKWQNENWLTPEVMPWWQTGFWGWHWNSSCPFFPPKNCLRGKGKG